MLPHNHSLLLPLVSIRHVTTQLRLRVPAVLTAQWGYMTMLDQWKTSRTVVLSRNGQPSWTTAEKAHVAEARAARRREAGSPTPWRQYLTPHFLTLTLLHVGE